MPRAMPKTINGTFQEPVFILGRFWVTNGRLDNGDFIRGEDTLTEGIFSVALLEDLSLLNRHTEK